MGSFPETLGIFPNFFFAEILSFSFVLKIFKSFSTERLTIIRHADKSLQFLQYGRHPLHCSFQAAKHFFGKCYYLPMQSFSPSPLSASPRGLLNVINNNRIHMAVIFCSGGIDTGMIQCSNDGLSWASGPAHAGTRVHR